MISKKEESIEIKTQNKEKVIAEKKHAKHHKKVVTVEEEEDFHCKSDSISYKSKEKAKIKQQPKNIVTKSPPSLKKPSESNKNIQSNSIP